MYNSDFGFRKTPFSAAPDPDCFYAASSYQDLFATVRYGIESRKGLIVITGEVGTGKTTLLRRLARSLEATTQSVFICHTHLGFTELLRLAFRDLGLQPQGRGSLTMMEELRDYLTAQFEKGRIIALLIDEAQNLSDAAFEGIRLLCNLDTGKENLLQIVLMGQPQLEARLDQPRLRHVKQRITVRCRLAPLEDEEVGPYIQFRLEAAGYEGKALFSADAVERIAFYSSRVPRLVNTICDNALLTAHANSRKEIDAETIERVADDLRLKEETRVKTEAPEPAFSERSETKEMEEIPLAAEGEAVADEPWESGLNEEFQVPVDDWPMRPHRRRRVLWAGTGALLGMVLFGGVGVALSPQARAYLWNLGADLETIIGIPGQNSQHTQQSSEAIKEGTVGKELQLRANAPDENALLAEAEKQTVSPPQQAEKPAESQTLAPAGESPRQKGAKKPSIRIAVTPKSQAPARASTDADIERQRLQLEIYKAIDNRAITGVEVSVIGRMTYLGGRVETERQKLAAEEAARSVPGVKEVRNRIAVNAPLTPSEAEGVTEPSS